MKIGGGWLAFPVLVACAAMPLAAQGGTARAVCSTTEGDSVIYVTPVFDARLKAGPYRSRMMGQEFAQYIKGRFDHRHSDPASATCNSYYTADQAEGVRAALLDRLAQARLRVVPVDWQYQPSAMEVAFADTVPRPDFGEPSFSMGHETQGYCMTEPFTRPLYVSAVFDLPQPANLATTQMAWMKYLTAKHGYTGDPATVGRINPVYCSDGGRGDPARMIAARVAGARAAGRTVVETGWKPGAP